VTLTAELTVTVETTIDAEAIDAFYALYAAAFGPLSTLAAARHLLTAEEFAEEMTDERIDKYVVRDEHGVPIALTTIATDLTAVPWISPEFYAERYPEQYARSAVYYLGYTLVRPEHAGRRVFTMMIERVERRMAEERAVCGLDVCAYNDGRQIGRHLAGLGASAGARVERLDVQTYYAANFA
jgi:hypothetical protein